VVSTNANGVRSTCRNGPTLKLNKRLSRMGRRMATTISTLWRRYSPDMRLRVTTSRAVATQTSRVL
jgi:hypothetical protein